MTSHGVHSCYIVIIFTCLIFPDTFRHDVSTEKHIPKTECCIGAYEKPDGWPGFRMAEHM